MGFEYIARIAPVRGSSATTEPVRAPSDSFAVRWTWLCTVRMTSPSLEGSEKTPLSSRSCSDEVRPVSSAL